MRRAYVHAGESGETQPSAYAAMGVWRISSSWTSIPVGTTVYKKSVTGAHGWSAGVYYADYGHVGIYVGNNSVASLIFGTVVVEPLANWTGPTWYGWGWNGGVPLV